MGGPDVPFILSKIVAREVDEIMTGALREFTLRQPPKILFLTVSVFFKEIENTFFMFLSSYRNTDESLENEKCCRDTCRTRISN